MNESRESKEQELFQQALERGTAESRAAFLDAACGGDAALRRKIDLLLEGYFQADGFLTNLPTRTVPESPGALPEGAEPRAIAEPLQESAGEVIGRYKLLEKLGEGGWGSVYVAEQTKPVRRRVALKVIKLGMDTKAVVARFEAERQALAMMDHPNIARVLDAGTTASGRPFFVMELVRGIRITDYCDQNNLSTQERLQLFVKVCQAIQHAHQKGIIHRDIKPSNILVTLHDGVPVPKVIDFGIAKATDGRLVDATVYTQLHQFIGTPAYMSPEQAEMSGLDIDTRSDIYSLGVLLYELLTGKTPFESRELIEAGIDGMRRMIRESEPARPSTRLSTMTSGDLTTAAKSRSVDGVRLIHIVRGDLDWIVMKALEKDRTRRYETANGFAVDIQRHLNNEPVVARPPTALYKLQKAARRNRIAWTAGAAVALALVLGAFVSYWQAARARAAEKLANQHLAEVAAERDAKEQARLEAEQVATFLQEVFQSPDPGRDGRTVTVAETLDRAVRELDVDLAQQPERRAQLQRTLAATYSALGLYTTAIPLFENARNYWAGTLGSDHPKTVRANVELLEVHVRAGRFEDALLIGEETRKVSERVNGPEHPQTLWAMHHLASAYYSTGRLPDAVALQERVLELRRKNPEADPAGLHMAINNLGRCYLASGRNTEGLRLTEEARDLAVKIYPPNHMRYLQAQFNVGVAYFQLGRHAQARQIFEEWVPRSRKILGEEHPFLVLPLHYLGMARFATGAKEESLPVHREAERLVRKVYGIDHPEAARVFSALSQVLADLGRVNEREKLWTDLLATREENNGLDHPSTITARQQLASVYLAQGKFSEARSLLRKIDTMKPWPSAAHFALMHISVLDAWSGERDSYETRRTAMLARFGSTSDLALGERIAKSALLLPLDGDDLRIATHLAEQAFNAGETHTYSRYFFFTGALSKYRAGDWAAAAQRAKRALALAPQGPAFLVALDHLILAMAQFQMGRPDEARTAFRKADEIIQDNFPDTLKLGHPNWHDILAAHLLRREAEAVLEPTPSR